MHYLHAALTETLRLYPVVPLNNKVCFSNDVLPNGFNIHKDDIVFYQPYAMGRMPYLWVNDAEIFKPERWLDERGSFQDMYREGFCVPIDEDFFCCSSQFLSVQDRGRERSRDLPHGSNTSY